jgi:putative SOS response-associated peptidase YedK
MCNVYQTTSPQRLALSFSVPAPVETYLPIIGPWQCGPIVRHGRVDIGQWGLIPWFSETRKAKAKDGRPLMTNNCRSETMATAPTFKGAWARGQRCLIPAESFDEPYWGSGKNIWWRFSRADGEPWALAGIWSDWTDPTTGEMVLSFTMLTQNADGHGLMGLMHKPDPKLPADKQDKRSVVPIERANWDQWLLGPPATALALLKVPSVEIFKHGPVDQSVNVLLDN